MTDRSIKRWPFWITGAVLLLVFVYLIRAILLPFVLGIFTAYFLDPAADRLEKAKLSRGVATMVITGCFFFTIIVLSLIIIPILTSQFSGLLAALPGYITEFQVKFEPQLTHWLGEIPTEQMDSFKSAVSDFSGIMVKLAGEFVSGLFHSGMAFINLLSLFLITPVVAFYLLRDWDMIVNRLDRLLPRSHAGLIRQQINIIDETLAGFIRGQLNVCLLLGTYYAIGLSLAGLKFGIIIGLATGLLVIFPYVGLMLGMSIGLGVAFFQFDTFGPIGAVLAVFLIGQVAEGYFITPKLVGEKIGLHPVWIIFGMLAGGALFGFVGIFLAVPVTAVIGVLIRFALDHYLESTYYHGGKPTRSKS